MKNLVILSGGGFKSAYQVGAISALKEAGLTIDCIMGTSGGALNASMVAIGKSHVLFDIWEGIAKNGSKTVFESDLIDLDTMKLKFGTLIKSILPSIGLKLLSPKGRKEFITLLDTNIKNINYLATTQGLSNLLKRYITIDSVKIPLFFNFVSLSTGQEVITSHKDYILDEEFINGIVASASIPLLLEPKKVFTNNAVYDNCVDGGVCSNVLISKAIKFIKASDIPKDWCLIIINCDNLKPKPIKKLFGLVDIFQRVVLNIMLGTLVKKDINTLDAINELTSSTNGKYLSVPYFHIYPQDSSLGETMEINEKLNNTRISKGYTDTKQILNLQ